MISNLKFQISNPGIYDARCEQRNCLLICYRRRHRFATILSVYFVDAVKPCQVFFVENERTARRFLKLLWKEMVIDDWRMACHS